ncbi:MAG: helix-turn-helix domain-containing protein [Planctomycetota bacterium]|jgi:transcriptional regulator with XRE-family HTH domain
MDNHKIGLKIAQLRKQQNLSTTELAKRTGLSQPQISRLENGHQGFRSATLARIADALEVTPAYFFDEEATAVKKLQAQQQAKREEMGATLHDELRAQYGDLSSIPGWRQLIRRFAAVISRDNVDTRTLRRLIDRVLSMSNEERARFLKRITGK